MQTEKRDALHLDITTLVERSEDRLCSRVLAKVGHRSLNITHSSSSQKRRDESLFTQPAPPRFRVQVCARASSRNRFVSARLLTLVAQFSRPEHSFRWPSGARSRRRTCRTFTTSCRC